MEEAAALGLNPEWIGKSIVGTKAGRKEDTCQVERGNRSLILENGSEVGWAIVEVTVRNSQRISDVIGDTIGNHCRF